MLLSNDVHKNAVYIMKNLKLFMSEMRFQSISNLNVT